jgi:hypothetical protein
MLAGNDQNRARIVELEGLLKASDVQIVELEVQLQSNNGRYRTQLNEL